MALRAALCRAHTGIWTEWEGTRHSAPELAAAAADLDAQRDYSAQLADRCQVAERRAAEAALALSKSIAEQDLLIKRYARQGAGAAAKAVSPLGAFNE